MSIVHIVLFKLKASLSEQEKKQLADVVRTSRDQEAYIVSASGGVDHSWEGLQDGLTHGFVLEFASKEDRDYYVKQDPSHLAFVEKDSPQFEVARVLDYEKGVFNGTSKSTL